MKRFWLLFVVLFLLSISPVVYAQDTGARFTDYSGEVIVFPESDPDDERMADRSLVLSYKDHVKTGGDSSAIIGFSDLSTIVMKARSELIFDSPPDKQSKMTLVAGHIWVNVKKMVKDGTLDVTMNQAVAGIKGTNITCSSDPASGEDRVKVLRGRAQVLIRSTQEVVDVEEGQELVIKKGKPQLSQIDIDAAQEEWKQELEQMGSSLQLNEVPETLQHLMRSEQEEFGAVQESFQNLVASEECAEEDIKEFRKLLERFVGMLQEDTLVLASLRIRVENELKTEGLTPADRTVLSGYQSQIGDALARLQSYRAQAATFAKTSFKQAGHGKRDEIGDKQETDAISSSLQDTWGEVDGLLTEAQNSPSVSWFRDAVDKCNDALEQLQQLNTRLHAYLESYPSDKAAQALLKRSADYQQQITVMLRGFQVIEVPPATISQMQDIEDHLGDAMVKLQDEIAAYNTIIVNADTAERRLRSTLTILNDFSKTRRLYLNAQRLFDSTMRAAAGQKFKSSEQIELQSQFDRIADNFQQLGSVADELNTRLNDLEQQLSGFLR